jgi:hypothetical protein
MPRASRKVEKNIKSPIPGFPWRTSSGREVSRFRLFHECRHFFQARGEGHPSRGKDHVGAWDFVSDRTTDGRALKGVTRVDEFPGDGLRLEVARRMPSGRVQERIGGVIAPRGTTPPHAAATTGWSASWRRGGRMCRPAASSRSSSNRGVRGRTGLRTPSTGKCGTNVWATRSSGASWKPAWGVIPNLVDE